MDQENKEPIPRNTDKKRIEALEDKVQLLTDMVMAMAHHTGTENTVITAGADPKWKYKLKQKDLRKYAS